MKRDSTLCFRGIDPHNIMCRKESELGLLNQAFGDLVEKFSWDIIFEVSISALPCNETNCS